MKPNTRYYFAFLFLLLSIFTAVACSHYYIEQEVDTFGSDINIVTKVKYGDRISWETTVKYWFDETITDSVKCLRYNQAKELIEKIESVENFKCE